VIAPAPSAPDQGAFFARWLAVATLLLFAGPLAVALIVLAAWWLTPSVRGRGRDLRPLVGPAVGGCIGLAAWSVLSSRSPLEDGLIAQVMLAKALVTGYGGVADDVIGPWLTRVGPLAVGVGPLLALAAAWKISRRAADDEIPRPVANLARGGAEHPADGVLLGFRADGRPVSLRSRELAAHMLVAGGTQAGKSTFVKRQVEGLSHLGHVVLIMDGKADPGLPTFLRTLNPDARIWIPGAEAPPLHLLGGSPSEFAAKLIDVHRWTEPHYRAINHRYALQLGTYFELSGQARTPASVIRLLVPDNLDAAADMLSTRLRRAGETARAEAALAITTYTAELLKDPARRLVVAGLADRFAGIVEGGLSGCLDDAPCSVRLETMLAAPGLWYLGLPGDTMPDEIEALGAWLLLELARVAHYRRSAGASDVQAHVVVEELSAFGHGALHLEHVLARARDAHIAVVVTTQALADVRALSSTLPDQLLANTGVQVFFHMSDREASWAASALGSGEAEQETLSEDASGSFVRRSRRTFTAPLVPARVLENFGVGDAILSAAATVTGRERRLERFRVALPGPPRRGTSRSARAAARVLAVSMGALVAALVLVLGVLNPTFRGFTHSNQVPSTARLLTVSRSAALNAPASPIRAAESPVVGPTAVTVSVPSPAVGPKAIQASVPRSWRVGNTDRLGVYLRAKPDGPTMRAWPDSTLMEAVGAPAIGSGGEVWNHVRAPDGGTGWVKERYLVDARNEGSDPTGKP
jgi:hypothetical protein